VVTSLKQFLARCAANKVQLIIVTRKAKPPISRLSNAVINDLIIALSMTFNRPVESPQNFTRISFDNSLLIEIRDGRCRFFGRNVRFETTALNRLSTYAYESLMCLHGQLSRHKLRREFRKSFCPAHLTMFHLQLFRRHGHRVSGHGD